MTTTNIKEQIAKEYPIRYEAFENPRVWITNGKPEKSGGHEWGVYNDPMKNEEYPQIEDGIYIEIISYQSEGLRLDCHATIPNRSRKQFGRPYGRYGYNEYEKAKADALIWLAEAEQIIRDAILKHPVYIAWNESSKVRVCWLGVTKTLDEMDERLKKYDAPSHIIACPSDDPEIRKLIDNPKSYKDFDKTTLGELGHNYHSYLEQTKKEMEGA